MKYADLHIHTNFSDGTATAADIVNEAHQQGLSCIAITDHDTVAGIVSVKQQALKFSLEVIPGVELSVQTDSQEIHILGYFIDWQARWFQDKLNQFAVARRRRALLIIEKLKAQGINLKTEKLLSKPAGCSIGRLHIARIMYKQGFVYSLQEAFSKYIGDGRPCYVHKFTLSPAQAIEMIYRLNGLAVLAHPYHIGNDQLIPELVQLGLRGIEVFNPEHDEATSAYYQNLAKKYGLLVTGGTDYHGRDSNKAMIGAIKLPYSLIENLKQEVEKIKSGADS